VTRGVTATQSILLVTPNFELALDLLASFEDVGHRVEHVPDLETAMSLPRGLPVDIVVIELEGSACDPALLRNWTTELDAPVVLVSASAEGRRLAGRLGAIFFQRVAPAVQPSRLAVEGDASSGALWAWALVDAIESAVAERRARLDASATARRRLEQRDSWPESDAPRLPTRAAVLQRDVLVVDDDAATRQTLRDVLQEEGYSVSVAEDGRAALALMRSTIRPRMILLDLMMPGMDGWQLREELLLDPGLARIPIAVCSVLAPFDRRSALDVQATLKKPIELAHLLRTVESLLG